MIRNVTVLFKSGRDTKKRVRDIPKEKKFPMTGIGGHKKECGSSKGHGIPGKRGLGTQNSWKKGIGDTPKDTKNLGKGIGDLQDCSRVMKFLGKGIGWHKKPGKGDWSPPRIPH